MRERESEEIERIKDQMLFQATTKKARERINMVRSVNPMLAQSAEMATIEFSRKKGRKVGEEEVRKILGMLSKKRQTKMRG